MAKLDTIGQFVQLYERLPAQFYETYQQLSGNDRARFVAAMARQAQLPTAAVINFAENAESTFLAQGLKKPLALKARRVAERTVSASQWVERTRFHADSFGRVRAKTIDSIHAAIADNKRPVVVFDLDDTLFSSAARTVAILQAWVQLPATEVKTEIRRALSGIKLDQVRYSFDETLEQSGLGTSDPDVVEAYDQAKEFWLEQFFSNNFVHTDLPISGAIDFVREVYDSGADVVYLTGRDEPRMGDGTRRAIAQYFPEVDGRRVRLYLKQDKEEVDEVYKARAAKDIGTLGDVVATFDNQPGNVSVFSKAYPGAINTFVDTRFGDNPAELVPMRVYRIPHFR